jgi:arylsulfatase A-like enzyme
MPGPNHLSLYDGMDIWEPPTLFDDYSDRASVLRKQTMEIGRHMSWDGDMKLMPLLEYTKEGKKLGGQYSRLTEKQMRAWDAVYKPKNDAFRRANLTGRDLVRWKYQRYIKDYLRCIASVDDNIGRLLRYLDEEGLAENTVVIYSSDQGFYLGEHGWFDKRWIFDESLKTPLIVRWPGVVEAGSEDTHLVSNVDYPETFLEIAGAEIPADMQGKSLVPILKGEIVEDWRKSFYYHYYEGPKAAHSVARHYGVVTATHKLVHYYDDGEWDLYDTELDPLELKSFYGDPRYADITEKLKAELARLRKELKVPEDN